MLVALFFPGILIYFIYSILGGVMGDMFGVDEDQTYNVCIVNCPDWLTEETLEPIGNFVVTSANALDEGVEEKSQRKWRSVTRGKTLYRLYEYNFADGRATADSLPFHHAIWRAQFPFDTVRRSHRRGRILDDFLHDWTNAGYGHVDDGLRCGCA